MKPKKIAQQAARQLAREPWEILKTARKQVTQVEKVVEPKGRELPEPAVREKTSPLEEEKMKVKSKRLMEALETEIEDIRKQKIEEEAEKLKEETLRAKMEAEQEKKKPAPEISGKRPRKFPAGLKGMKFN